MNKQDVSGVLGASEADMATDAFFIKLMSEWHEARGSIAVHIMRAYKKSQPEKVRNLILKYISLLLLNPEIVHQRDKIILAGPTVIIPHFGEVRHVLDDLAALDEYEKIFAPVLYKLGIKAAGKDHQTHFGILREILGFPNVYKIFAREYAWGLARNDHNCFISFNYLHGEEGEGQATYSAIVDPFLEPFIYRKNEEGCLLLMDKEPYRLRELNEIVVKGILDYQYDLYALLLSLVKRDAVIKENMVKWLRRVYLKNTERNKMMFDRNKFMSDGYAFNLNGVLGYFARGIVHKGIMDFDLEWFEGENIVSVCPRDSSVPKSKAGAVFTFQTAIFFSKAILGNLAFTKMLEKMNEFSMRVPYIDRSEVALLRILESLLNAYRLILYSDIAVAEIPFLHHMESYALKNPVPEIFLNFYLNLGEFLVGKFDFSPSSQLCANILESPNFSLHSKVPTIKIIFNSNVKVRGELLVKFYVDIEKLDASERRGVRYYLNRILMDYEINDVKFINCVLKDLETLLSNGLGALIDLKKKYDTKVAQQAKSSFFCLAELFKLLKKLIVSNPSLFLEKEILPQFVTILNYNLKIIVGPRCSELKCPDASTSLGFEPKEFLREMLMLYMAMNRHSDVFLVTVVKDTMYFNLSLLKRAFKICDTKGVLDAEEIVEMHAMMMRAETLVTDNVEDDLIVPEQFIDPVTCMPMRDPVRLKTSNAVIDKSTFDMLLMNSGIDPFNREVLTEDGCVVDEEMKKEIDEYWAKRVPNGDAPH